MNLGAAKCEFGGVYFAFFTVNTANISPFSLRIRRNTVMEHHIKVHDMRGVASSTADFGLPPIYEDKQLILVGGRVRRFTTDELSESRPWGQPLAGSTLMWVISRKE